MTDCDRTPRRRLRWLARFAADKSGNFSILMAFILPLLLGALGIGFEVSGWYMTKRAMQNAADAAVIAAATNGGTNYDTEARAVASQYGFINGANNVTVTASNAAACPAGGSDCYSVSIAGAMPVYLAKVVGYTGNTTINGTQMVSITSTAISSKAQVPHEYCVLALGSSGSEGIRSNGAPNANLTGCSVMSDTTSTCNGGNLLADTGAAHGANDGCGVQQYSNVPAISDPYSGLATNIPANTCTSYPQAPSHVHDTDLPASNLWSGSRSMAASEIACGDIQLTSDVTITSTGPGSVLVINNGKLDTNGHTLRTANGSALTIVFSGTSGSYSHYPTDSTNAGVLDFNAPTSGAWKGVALYQNPSLTSGVDFTYAGNNPAWDLTGLAYFPHASVTMSGAVNKSSNGYSCFALVVDNVTINGTANILSRSECDLAGLDLPTNVIYSRTQLVY